MAYKQYKLHLSPGQSQLCMPQRQLPVGLTFPRFEGRIFPGLVHPIERVSRDHGLRFGRVRHARR